MRAYGYIQAAFISIAVAGLSVTALCPSLSRETLLQLFVVLGMLVGMPHGALDYDVAKHLGLARTWREAALFLSAYLAIAATNFIAWVYLPFEAFLFFMLLSAYHFGEDWSSGEYKVLKRIVFGISFVTLPALIHAQELAEIFSWLIPITEAEAFVMVSASVGQVVCLVAFAMLGIELVYKKQILPFLVGALFITSAVYTPPIFFLLIVFCFLHAPRHTAELYEALKYPSVGKMVSNQLPILVATALLFALVVLFRSAALEIRGQATFSALIVLIACLTTPHMLLVEYFHRSKLSLLFLRAE